MTKFKDEEILTESMQQESGKYLAEVDKIYEVKKQLLSKKQTATTEISRLNKELAELDKQYLFETDPEKIRELAQKKKDIRYEIDEYKQILETKYNPVIKEQLKNVEQFRKNAEKEKDKFDTIVSEKLKQCQLELDEFTEAMREKMEKLENFHYQHRYTQAHNKYIGMLLDKTDW